MSIKLEAGSITSVMTTELNSLANNAGALGAEYNNSDSANLFIWGAFELNVTFGSNPTAGSVCELYIIPAPDGTNYDDVKTTATAFTTGAQLAGVFALQASTSAQKIALGFGGARGPIWLPPTKFRVFLINKSGQAFPSSGSIVKLVPYRYQ